MADSQKLVLPQFAQSRYELVARIASGGMATVYLGRLRGAAGFWRLCAVKRAHAHLVEDEEARELLVTEARLASRLSHPHVVSVFDVEELDGELLLVMEYVEGASLSDLTSSAETRDEVVPASVALRIAVDACAGLHAAHECHDEQGEPLGLVHRDVSPQNILIGRDGVARITDFGIAKVQSSDSMVRTATGHLKGKMGYMAPEYIRGRPVDRTSDEFALAVVTWETLTGQRLFRSGNDLETMMRALSAPIPKLSRHVEGADDELDAIFARALRRSPSERYPTLLEFQTALEIWAGTAGMLATRAEVAAYVEEHAGGKLAARRALVRKRIAELDGESEALSGSRPLSSGRAPASEPPVTAPTSAHDETTTTAVKPHDPRGRRGASRALLIGIGGALLGALAVLGLQNRAPAPAAPHAAPEPTTSAIAEPTAPIVTAEPSVATSTTANAAPSASPRVPAPGKSPFIRRPQPKAPASADTPDPNPYGTP
jgi:serine/threonine-protein kinase